tara:strand:+ start:1357 stop:2325 length:969 start_codon:yes stop_codon:yes gene_type:complete
MAVYTKIPRKELDIFFNRYDLGKVKKFFGIKEGIENTNYFVQTEKNKFILTIYEKRVDEKDLPFFIGLMTNLNNSDFKCPKPIINRNGNYISEILGKKAAVVTFLEGKAKKNLSPDNCYEIGVETAKLHKITQNLSLKRQNNLSLNSWSELFYKVEKDSSKIYKKLPETIKKSLEEIKKNWPNDLPSGIIHGDLFPDNIFFKNNKFTGMIDFYFSCNDFYSFEIAICINALCFDGAKENLSFNVTKAKKFIKGYTSVRKLENNEKKYLKVLSQGASMRFLLTRVFDYLNLSKGAIVTVKDPVEYLKRLEFHNNVKSFEDYCI